MAEMVRLNTRIGAKANEWLDAYSDETGIPKSTLIHLAVESYIQQKDAMDRMADMGKLLEAVERLEQKINEK